MKPKTLLVLVVLALGLGAFIALVERDLPSTDERREHEKRLLGGVEADDVTALVLRGENGATIRLERVAPEEDDATDDPLLAPATPSWRLAEPLDAPADADAARALVGRLVALEKDRTLDEVDAARLGLDSPRASVTVELRDGGSRILRVGADLPLGDGTIVGGDEADVAWTASLGDLVETLGREVDAWRDRTLFGARDSQVERVTIERRGTDDAGRTVLARSDERRFTLEEPLVDTADTDAVRGLLGSLSALEATRFSDDDTPFEVVGEVEVVLADADTPWRIEWAAPGDGSTVRARVTAPGEPPRSVAIDPSPLAEVTARPPEAWRSRAWTSLQVFQVDRAVLEVDGGDPVELVRESGNWHRDGVTIDFTLASNALYPLAEARAEELVDRPAAVGRGHAFDTPRLVVTLVADEETQTLSLFDTVDGLAAATVEGRDAVLLLPADTATTAIEAAIAARDAEATADD